MSSKTCINHYLYIGYFKIADLQAHVSQGDAQSLQICYFQTFYFIFFTTAYWQKVNIVSVLKYFHVFMFLYSEARCAFSSRDLHYKIFWWRGTLCEEYPPQEKRAGKLQVQVGYASKAGFTLQSHRATFFLNMIILWSQPEKVENHFITP